MWIWIPIIYVVYAFAYMAYKGLLKDFFKTLAETDFSVPTKEEEAARVAEWKRKYPEPHYLTDYVPPVNNPMSSGNQFMSREDKQAYLMSTKWQIIRKQVLARDGYQCQSCGSRANLSVHHVDYTNLGDESLSDLVALCQSCHSRLHERLGYDRTTLYPITKDYI